MMDRLALAWSMAAAMQAPEKGPTPATAVHHSASATSGTPIVIGGVVVVVVVV